MTEMHNVAPSTSQDPSGRNTKETEERINRGIFIKTGITAKLSVIR